MIPFQGTIRRYGSSYVVTIPADYVKNDLLTEGKRYQFTADEVQNAE